MSRKEEQRKIREEKQRAAEQKAVRSRKLGKGALYIGLPFLLALIAYALISQAKIYPPDEVAEHDHVRGDPDGVILMVYADFQCPACATEHRLMAQAWNRISDKAQLVFRHYPLSNVHAHAWTAALYSEAAGQQGKFWEMYDQLFLNQAYWSTLSEVEPEFDGYLRDLGLDVEQAHADMRSDDVLQKVRSDQRGGTRAGVRGTPALFVDGELVPVPQTVAELTQLVDRAAAAAAD